MRTFLAVLFAVVSIGLQREAQAKCGYALPCRSMHVTVVSCELDSKYTVQRRESLTRLENEAPTPMRDEWMNQQREELRKKPFDFRVEARIERAIPKQCEPLYSYFPISLKLTDVYSMIDIMKREMIESVGGVRSFYYSGSGMFECANLNRAREFSVHISGWCEFRPSRAEDLRLLPIAFIDTYR